MKKLIITSILTVCSLLTFGQDLHFSQFYNSQLTLNPALTGSSIGNVRLTANYRDQWGSVSKFRTIAFAADMSIKDKELDNFGGVGLYMVKDESGSNGYATNKIYSSFAYHNSVGKDGYLALGLQAGLFTTSLSSSNITTDQMWQASKGLDESADNGENTITANITSLDFNAGLLYYHFLGERGMAFGGASLFHLMEPNNSFTGENFTLPRRFLFHGGVKYPISDVFNIFPKIIYMTQGGAAETNIGTSLEYDISDNDYKVFAIGAWYRNKDAIIIMASAEVSDLKLGLSYDINISGLKSVTNLQGGLELSLTYTIGKPSKRSSNLSTQNPRY